MTRGMMARVLAPAAALVMAAAAPAAAQGTPEATLGAFFDTFRTGDFAANAAMMDPAALVQLKETLVGFAALPGAADDGAFQEMFGVAGVEELRALEPAVLYERMLRGTLGDEDTRGILAGAQVTPLGHVMEGDTAHVVYRMRMEFAGQVMEQVQVAPMVRVDGAWKVRLTGSLAGMMPQVPRAEP